jgi:hypothetical protein
MDAFVAGLKSQYGEAAVTTRAVDGRLLVKVMGVPIPRRNGTTTDALVVLVPDFRTSGGRPAVFFKPGTTQPNGRQGRNVNATLLHGEPWLTMSWQFEWSATMPAWALVEGAVRRFAVNED